jgi:hypothetical protein
MKKTLFTTLGILCASLLFAADGGDAKADIKAAAKKLGNNYSWTATPKIEGGGGGGGGGQFRAGPTEGQTDKGIVYLKSSFGDRSMESAAKGDKVLFKGEDGWEMADGDAQGPSQFVARRMKTFKAPAIEAADLADKTKSLKSADGVISGDLTEEAAKELLAFGGGRGGGGGDRPAPKDAKGSVKYWIKDGALTKYELTVSGKMANRDGEEVTRSRTTTTEIKEVGKTKLGLSEDNQKKLS